MSLTNGADAYDAAPSFTAPLQSALYLFVEVSTHTLTA